MRGFPLAFVLLALQPGCVEQPSARAERPPIDTAASAKTETATFALG